MAGMAEWYISKPILATSPQLTAPQINTLGSCIGNIGAIPCCFICPNPYKPVHQGNVGLVTKFGRFARAVDPGLVYVNPLSEQLVQVDIKIQIVEVPKQVCMTKDNVSLNLTSVIYYRITSPHKAAFSISNIRQALVERTQTTLRHVVGARVLQDVIERREEIAQSIREIIEETALGWGVEVESMLVKDIIFSQELQDSLSMAAQSKRTGEAKVIAARAEVESAKRKSRLDPDPSPPSNHNHHSYCLQHTLTINTVMRQAADVLSSAPAMQIRYLETMQSMARTANSKIIFMPGPADMGSVMAQAIDEGEISTAQKVNMPRPDPVQQAVNARVLEDL
jgi:erythrocyte band 7 integral membrane protein